MKVPLDYYRILGLPPQATAEQLQQAHRDLSLQLPRREFSEVVISSRKYLIDQAYQVLSDVDRRRDYDAKLLATAYPVPASLPLETRSNGQLGTDTDLGEATLRSLAIEPAVGEEIGLTITIEPEHLGGALLILLDLGEYEQVLSLAQPYGPVATT
ncbi:MAG: J domain-containing protein, partial [Cyanobacteriota bacterium]|nr:J domain-containing protein [Cyanobacteriota bacterium]